MKVSEVDHRNVSDADHVQVQLLRLEGKELGLMKSSRTSDSGVSY